MPCHDAVVRGLTEIVVNVKTEDMHLIIIQDIKKALEKKMQNFQSNLKLVRNMKQSKKKYLVYLVKKVAILMEIKTNKVTFYLEDKLIER